MSQEVETVRATFNGGPKHQETIGLTIPDGKGNPQIIKVIAVDPETETHREGVYQQSPLAAHIYQWAGWTTDLTKF